MAHPASLTTLVGSPSPRCLVVLFPASFKVQGTGEGEKAHLTPPHLLPSASPLRITAECLGDTALLTLCREVNLTSSASWINSTSKFGSWPRAEPWSLENEAQIHEHSEEEKG